MSIYEYTQQMQALHTTLSMVNYPVTQMVRQHHVIQEQFKALNNIGQIVKPLYESLEQLSDNMKIYSYAQEVVSNMVQTHYNISSVTMQIEPIFNTIKELQTINVSVLSMKPIIEPIQSVVSSMQANSHMTEYLNRITDIVSQIPDSAFRDLEIEDKYTKEEALNELKSVTDEFYENSNVQSVPTLDVKEYVDQFWKMMREKHKPLYNLLMIILLMLNAMATLDTIHNVAVPFIQDTIVLMEGKTDTFYIKEDNENGVKIYAEPSCKSDVVQVVYYGEEVTRIEDIKMWLQVSYITEDGDMCEGWIAKRNLLSYKDYLFNADKLCELE